MSKTDERTYRYLRNQGRRGFVQIRIWIPRGQVNKIKTLAAKMRQEWKDLLY